MSGNDAVGARTSIDTKVLEKMLNFIAQKPWVEVREIMAEIQNSIRPCECHVNFNESDIENNDF